MDRIRTLIVDDHAPFRAGLRTLLGTADDVEVCGEAATGEEALAAVVAHHPDVVLLDLTMPGMGGITATERIVTASPHARVLVLSMSGDDDSVLAALRAGARGYLLKGAARAEILRAVRTVAGGEAILGPSVAGRLPALLAPAAAAPPPFPQLSAREREVLAGLAAGLTNPRIASRLGLSEKTVRNLVSAVLAKLGVADRAEAADRARAAGLGP
ncbi:MULTISPECIES: response regulator transcription factor [Pseudonocardia]|uniref:Transcriptional regulatory protein DegU n=2 Tax=Pseudonocardia TaxID=1847 RepID=A0A1Y2N218_PSEAH|nr:MULTISPECIES: response regulator transcription factor [Pseudonocardia]OSY41492.1 Transcriptional regulatory protein DegU [Pseudonocardia autotrophica]TDN71448.1 LuxR family two component transcriptional regulator [Pseudonocardia autotrophica]BBG02123.1 DNA-binding response regulator [Pseudonocardia autotrophica]GEC24137.1 DNA-binding response regulator [Pseudonocardia saturnea]